MEVGIQDTLIVKEGFQIQENLLLAEPNKHHKHEDKVFGQGCSVAWYDSRGGGNT